MHRPYHELTPQQKYMLWNGTEYFDGIYDFFKYLEYKTHKIQYRVLLSRYRGRTNCPDCRGTRLRKDAQYVKVVNISITDLVLMAIEDVLVFFDNLKVPEFDRKISDRILTE